MTLNSQYVFETLILRYVGCRVQNFLFDNGIFLKKK